MERVIVQGGAAYIIIVSVYIGTGGVIGAKRKKPLLGAQLLLGQYELTQQ